MAAASAAGGAGADPAELAHLDDDEEVEMMEDGADGLAPAAADAAASDGDDEGAVIPRAPAAKRPRKEVDAVLEGEHRANRFPSMVMDNGWVDSSDTAKEQYIRTGRVRCVACNKGVAVGTSTGNLGVHAGGDSYVVWRQEVVLDMLLELPLLSLIHI